MNRNSQSIMNLINATIAAVQMAACDKQTGKDVLNKLIRMFTDDCVDGRYMGFRVSTAVTAETQTIFDHIVPVDFVCEHLLAASIQPPQDLQLELASALRIAKITTGENDRLNASGLKSAMPKGWKWGDSAEDRYREVGINLEPAIREVDAAIQRLISSTFP